LALDGADIAAIQNLYAGYGHFIDEGNGERFSQCFTHDGSLGTEGGKPLEGRAAISRFAATPRPGVRHVVVNVHVEGNDDEAVGRAYFVACDVSGRPVKVLTTGRYRDSLRRVDGSWLFTHRHFTPDPA
jgi:uncharacterized protein (TIGR02246 family)